MILVLQPNNFYIENIKIYIQVQLIIHILILLIINWEKSNLKALVGIIQFQLTLHIKHN